MMGVNHDASRHHAPLGFALLVSNINVCEPTTTGMTQIRRERIWTATAARRAKYWMYFVHPGQ